MWDPEIWKQAADCEAALVLESCKYDRGEIDAVLLARRLGCDVIFDRNQISRGRLKRFGKRLTIFLKPDDRPERVQWAASHEIGETLAYRVFQRTGVDPANCEPGFREHVANLLACRLLLPQHSFFADAESTNESLFDLKKIYPTASHELIAMRLLDLPIPGCVTVIDQGRIRKRKSSNSLGAQNLLVAEHDCWEKSHQQCCYQQHEADNLKIRCWPIHERNWKREILITRPSNEEVATAGVYLRGA